MRRARLIKHTLMMLSWYAAECFKVLYRLVKYHILHLIMWIAEYIGFNNVLENMGMTEKFWLWGYVIEEHNNCKNLPIAICGTTLHLIRLLLHKTNSKAPFVIYHSKIQKRRKSIASLAKLHNRFEKAGLNPYYLWNVITNKLN